MVVPSARIRRLERGEDLSSEGGSGDWGIRVEKSGVKRGIC